MTGKHCFCQRRVGYAEVYIRSAVHGMTSHDIMDIFDFSRYVTAGNDAMVADFQQRGLLRQTFQCQPCGRPYSQVRWKGSLLGYQLRCPDCRAKLSLSKDSFFEGMRMPLEKAYGLMYIWTYETPVNKAVDHLSASSATVVQWYQYFRKRGRSHYSKGALPLRSMILK